MSEWLTLELTYRAEGEDPEVVRSYICRKIRDKDAEVFIPVYVTTIGDKKTFRYLLEGYAFIKRTRSDDVYLKLQESTYVESVVSTGRKFSTVGDKEIDEFRRQLRQEESNNKPEVVAGDTVLITAGPYEHIEGTVERGPSEDDMVQVFFKLRSMEASVVVPRACLRLIDLLSLRQTGVFVVPTVTVQSLCANLLEKSKAWVLRLRNQVGAV